MGLPCRNLPVEEAPRGETFDLVYLNHVLEHLFDPARAIELAAGLVRRGGHLYVAVPNLWNECAAQAIHYVPHLSIFTERSLRRLLAAHGFQVERVELQHDIQIIARRSDAVERQPAGDADAFWSRLSDLMFQGFGGFPGRHGLVWFPVGDHEYRRFRVSRTQLWGLRLGVGMASRLPTPLSRLTPPLLRRRVRALDILLSGDRALPVTVAHSAPGQGAWTK
jgi:SAM-dependent methyltransferase